MDTNKEQDDFIKWLDEVDLFGLNEEIEIINFRCIDYGKGDEVPD